jgi:prepilin-type processing-associated H-X9-DG protein
MLAPPRILFRRRPVGGSTGPAAALFSQTQTSVCRDAALAALTLLEILVVLAIVATLAVLMMPAYRAAMNSSEQTRSLSNLHTIGRAIAAFTADQMGEMPSSGRDEKWPQQLATYLSSGNLPYADPADPANFRRTGSDPLDNQNNRTSYTFNGFNDVASADRRVRMFQIEQPSSTILVALKPDSTGFYMDLDSGNQVGLNLEAHGGGANFLFADGSAKLLRKIYYLDSLWLARKNTNT